MNMGYGVYDPNGDEIIDRGSFCRSNEIEDELLDKIDNERNNAPQETAVKTGTSPNSGNMK